MVTSRISPEVENKKQITFPCVMENLSDKKKGNSCLVLFNSLNTGMIIHSNIKSDSIGDYSEDWTNCDNEKIWGLFKGEVKLKND